MILALSFARLVPGGKVVYVPVGTVDPPHVTGVPVAVALQPGTERRPKTESDCQKVSEAPLPVKRKACGRCEPSVVVEMPAATVPTTGFRLPPELPSGTCAAVVGRPGCPGEARVLVPPELPLPERATYATPSTMPIMLYCLRLVAALVAGELVSRTGRPMGPAMPGADGIQKMPPEAVPM